MKYITDLSTVPVGTPISCFISGVQIYSGKIQRENNQTFICQNRKAGNSCNNKLGYNYSWSVGDGFSNSVLRNNVTKILLRHLEEPSEEEKKALWKKNVKKYVKNHNNSTLHFTDYVFDPNFRDFTGFSIKLSELDKIVVTVVALAKKFGSSSDKGKETPKEAYRSVLDIWRHTKEFIPDIDIFSIMRSLYKVAYDGEVFGVSYCSTIHRTVFSGGALKNALDQEDEFDGILEYWKDAKE